MQIDTMTIHRKRAAILYAFSQAILSRVSDENRGACGVLSPRNYCSPHPSLLLRFKFSLAPRAEEGA
jgi:hypothetical protein